MIRSEIICDDTAWHSWHILKLIATLIYMIDRSLLATYMIPKHVYFTCALRERTLSTTHRNVIVAAVFRRWSRLDFKMILHHVRYVWRVGHDWVGSGWRAFTTLASGPGRRRWCRWSTTTNFRRLMAFYQAV